MTGLVKALLALVLAVSLFAWWEAWGKRNAERAADEAALAPAKDAAASAKAKVETVTVKLAAATQVVTRVLTQVRTDTLMLAPQTRQDTATAVAQLPALAAAHDTLQRACTELVVNCADYKRAAELRFSADSVVIVKQGAIIAERPLPKHWRFGITGGYGALLTGGRVLTGPSATVGITWTPFN